MNIECWLISVAICRHSCRPQTRTNNVIYNRKDVTDLRSWLGAHLGSERTTVYPSSLSLHFHAALPDLLSPISISTGCSLHLQLSRPRLTFSPCSAMKCLPTELINNFVALPVIPIGFIWSRLIPKSEYRCILSQFLYIQTHLRNIKWPYPPIIFAPKSTASLHLMQPSSNRYKPRTKTNSIILMSGYKEAERTKDDSVRDGLTTRSNYLTRIEEDKVGKLFLFRNLGISGD